MEINKFKNAMDMAFDRLWMHYEQTRGDELIMRDHQQRNELKSELRNFTSVSKLTAQEGLRNRAYSSLTRALESVKDADHDIQMEFYFNFVKGLIIQFETRLARQSSEVAMKQHVPQVLVEAIESVYADSEGSRRLQPDLHPIVTHIRNQDVGNMQLEVGNTFDTIIKILSNYHHSSISPDVSLFPDWEAFFRELTDDILTDWQEHGGDDMITPDQREFIVQTLKESIDNKPGFFRELYELIASKSNSEIIMDKLIDKIFLLGLEYDRVSRSKTISHFFQVDAQRVIDSLAGSTENFFSKFEEFYDRNKNLILAKYQVPKRTNTDGEFNRQQVFGTNEPKIESGSNSPQDSMIFESIVDHMVSWYERNMRSDFQRVSRARWDRTHQQAITGNCLKTMITVLTEQIRPKTQDLRDYARFQHAKKNARSGNYNINTRMDTTDTYFRGERVIESFVRLLASDDVNFENRLKQLRSDLLAVPDFVYVREPRNRNYFWGFEPNIIPEGEIHRAVAFTELPLHMHYEDIYYQEQLGRPLSSEALNYQCVRQGIANLFSKTIHPMFQNYHMYFEQGADTIAQSIPQDYPENGDSAGVLGFFCEYSRFTVEKYAEAGYKQLFDSFGFPETADFFQPVESRLLELSEVDFVGCHMDLTPTNMLSTQNEAGWTTLDSLGEADEIRLIDAEKLIPAPIMLDVATMLGRCEFDEDPVKNEQAGQDIFQLVLKTVPKTFTGGKEKAERDLGIFISFEMVKSTLSDGVRSQQYLMKNGNVITDEIREQLRPALAKINKGFSYWIEAGLCSEILTEDQFVQCLREFNESKRNELLTMIKEQKQTQSQMVDSEYEALCDQINKFRLFWDQGKDFPSKGKVELIKLFKLMDDPNLSESQIDELILQATVLREFPESSHERGVDQTENQHVWLKRLQALDQPKMESVIVPGREKSRYTPTQVIDRKLFTELNDQAQVKLAETARAKGIVRSARIMKNGPQVPTLPVELEIHESDR